MATEWKLRDSSMKTPHWIYDIYTNFENSLKVEKFREILTVSNDSKTQSSLLSLLANIKCKNTSKQAEEKNCMKYHQG